MGAAPDLVLGLDGGGTKTVMALADRGGGVRLLRRGPTLDPFADPRWPDLLGDALEPATPDLARLGGAVLALPCHGEVPEVSRRQADAAARWLPAPHAVVNDVQAGFDGALAGAPGVLLLAGTGSMAWAGDGVREVRVGGWGEAFGDEGSAHWIGREALSEATRAIDGRAGAALPFAHALLDRLGLRADELVGWCYAGIHRRAAIAGVARAVDALAEGGDARAAALLDRAGDHLADHARAARAGLDLPDAFRWSYAGGLFGSRTVLRRVTAVLGREPQAPRLPPVGGALLRAARLGGWATDDRWVDALAGALAAADPSDTRTLSPGEPR